MEAKTMVYGLSYQKAAIRRYYMTGVFGWMTLALIITGLVAAYVNATPVIVDAVQSNRELFVVLFLVEIFMAMGLSAFLGRISWPAAIAIFLGYAVLNGITFAALFVMFTSRSIAPVFYITAAAYGITGLYGLLTKRNLSRSGNVLLFSLIGLLVTAGVNSCLNTTLFGWVVSYAGVFIFMALTAYDVQKIRILSDRASVDRQPWQKSAVTGALMLYLDFVNLFLFFLRIFSRKR